MRTLIFEQWVSNAETILWLIGSEFRNSLCIPLSALLWAEQGLWSSLYCPLKTGRCVDIAAWSSAPSVNNCKIGFLHEPMSRAAPSVRRERATVLPPNWSASSVLLSSLFLVQGKRAEEWKAARWFTAWDDCFWNHKMYSYNSLRQEQPQWTPRALFLERERKKTYKARDEKTDMKKVLQKMLSICIKHCYWGT